LPDSAGKSDGKPILLGFWVKFIAGNCRKPAISTNYPEKTYPPVFFRGQEKHQGGKMIRGEDWRG
jgi:hypothetical protein